MKNWLVHTLLLFALLGHFAHSFHEHNHDIGAEQCSICAVDDLSKVITDLKNYTTNITFYPTVYQQKAESPLAIITPLYRTRAPPLS